MSKLISAIRTQIMQAKAVAATAGGYDVNKLMDSLLQLLDDDAQVSKLSNISNASKTCAICGHKVPINKRAVYGEYIFHPHCAARSTVLSKNLVDRMQAVLNHIAVTEPPYDIIPATEVVDNIRNYCAAALGLPAQVIVEDRGEVDS